MRLSREPYRPVSESASTRAYSLSRLDLRTQPPTFYRESWVIQVRAAIFAVWIFAAALFGGAIAYIAANATSHGQDLRHDNGSIHVTNFATTLDGALLTAAQGIYHPDTGIIEFTGNVRLHLGKEAKTFSGRVK